MNAVFTGIFLISLAALTVIAPQNVLPALLNGAEKSLTMAVTLFCIYAVWMGLSRLAEKSGLSRAAARGLKPLTRRLFKTDSEAANENIAMNLSCNLLGIGGAATPYAVKAMGELEKENNAFAQKLLFIINATSVQIVPTTVIALRAGAGSAAAADIFLPSLLCTAFSTVFAAAIFIFGPEKWRT